MKLRNLTLAVSLAALTVTGCKKIEDQPVAAMEIDQDSGLGQLSLGLSGRVFPGQPDICRLSGQA